MARNIQKKREAALAEIGWGLSPNSGAFALE